MNRYLVAGLMVGTWSSCVLAADLGPYGPPPRYERDYEPVREAALDWQGFYVGVNGGHAWGAPDGWYGGGQVGYNAQFDRLVLGVEADLQGADISDSTSGVGPTTANVDIDWFSTVRGRIGYATGPALLYVTGGLAFADVDYSVTGPGVTLSKSSIKTGYTLGGGIEWAFDPNWSLKSEYLFVNLGDENLSSGGFSSRSETEFHTVRVGINYRF
jgi:outer membrane immunogenic protein